jgi:hypothetical protein
MTTRRDFLFSAATSAVIVPSSVHALSGGRRRRGVQILSTLKFENRTRSDINEGAVTQIVGCPFRKGDIPSGSWPQFQLSDGTPVPCTLLSALATSWSDGSLKFVPAMLQMPVAIGAHKSVVVNVLSGGWLPAASGRSLADFANGVAPQVQVDGLDNLAGTWVMDLTQGIAAETKITQYGNGAAGAVWKVRARAHQGHKSHKNLLCDFYVASLANLDGSLKGLRILGKVKLPYYDTTAKMNWMSFARFQLCRDASGTLVRDCFGKNFGKTRAYNFSWSSGSTFNANHGYASGDYAYCTRLSSTGGLPGGLAPDTSYFTGNPTSTTIGFSANAADPGNNLVAASDGGSGTLTATPYPYLAYFGSLFTAGPSGTWDFVQGAGSDTSDTALYCRIDQSYWLSTGLLPSYDLAIKPASNKAMSFWPNCSGPVTRYLETTGERDDIGILPSWYVRHFLTQAPVDMQAVRVVSLIGGQFSIGLESVRTMTLPCVNNGRNGAGGGYRGMPAPNYQFRWRPAGSASQGFPYGDTTNPNVQIAGFNQQITNHMPQFNYYPYLLTGEPWHLDMLLEHANSAIYQRYTPLGQADITSSEYTLGSGERSLQVPNAAPTYGDAVGSGEQRSNAWASALVAAAAGLCPDVDPDCVSYKPYFGDLNANTWMAAFNIYKALPSYAKRYGLWHVPDGDWPYIDHWQMAYLGAALSLAVAVTEDKRALMALNGLVKWFDHVVATFGGWHAGAYMTVVKKGGSSDSPLVTDDSGIAFYGPNIQWQSGNRFFVTPFSNYMPANGDRIVFADSVSGIWQVTPAGFAKYTPYYMVNLNGMQFDLAAQPGGSPVPLTDSYNGTTGFFLVSTRPPSTGSISNVGAPTSYNTEVAGMLNYALAVGATVQAATVADLAGRNANAGLSFVSDPKWGMASTFPPHR